MQNNEGIKNIWELYGVNENPFSISPILVIGGIIPIESFVGRKEEIKRLSKIMGSKGGSRVFVYGDVGVGKTSFVNVIRHTAFISGFFTPFKEIAVQQDWTIDDFMMNTLSAIYSTLKILKEQPISDKTFSKLESLFEIGRTSTNIGVSVMGSGGSYGREQNPTEKLTTFNLEHFFQEIIQEINTKTKKDTIIHYNNLELLPEKKIRYIFDNLRDFFQTRGVHFIFVGNLTVHSIIQSIPRFSSNLTDTPFHIETLTFEETKEIIIKRFYALKISDKYNLIYPQTENCLRVLYDLMEGNIRNILNSLSTAVLYATNEKAIVLDRNKLAKVLKEVLENRYLHNLTPKPREVLNEIVKHQEITNKSLADKLNMPRSNISTNIKNLEQEGCVYLRRKNGKDKFWSAEPKIKWSLLEEDPQQALNI